MIDRQIVLVAWGLIAITLTLVTLGVKFNWDLRAMDNYYGLHTMLKIR